MRSSSSYWWISPVARSMIGCAWSTSRSSSSASRITSVHDSREASRFGASLAGMWQATRSRPASLASYIARSALTSTSSPVRRRESNGATPIEALTLRRRPDGLEMRTARIASSRSAGDRARVLGAAVGHEHGELVAAQAGDHLAVAQALAQRVGDLADQLVAGAVAERVVDVLEQVDVDQHRGAARAVAGDVVDVALELALERAAVEQAGQRVVVGHVAQLGLVAAALGDVLGLGQEVQRRRRRRRARAWSRRRPRRRGRRRAGSGARRARWRSARRACGRSPRRAGRGRRGAAARASCGPRARRAGGR